MADIKNVNAMPYVVLHVAAGLLAIAEAINRH